MSRSTFKSVSLFLGVTGSLLMGNLLVGKLAMAHAQSDSQGHQHAAGTLICDSAAQPTRFQASYQITAGNDDKAQAHQLILTRFDDTIIYQRGPVSYEAWQKNGEYVRYFPEQKRSISYRRSDLLALNIHTDIDKQFHLIAPAALNQFDKGEQHQDACFTQQSYTHNSDSNKGKAQNQGKQQSLELDWINELQLPASLTITQGKQQLHYQLTKLTPINQQGFELLTSGYQDLDFADVGDSESDPFIAKMITQGFIQHGSSGFYSADGKLLEGGHDHHH
ncbi:hypothetical protein [Shewanella halotolerans]|uniref:hypothetical protein n=1 Tax=Shewanella halotolerans TaxID=2864204 RepID=UPI001C65752C|nr:hypothetical protein [Shewanella halotolerans]QYJ88939.1 hypothetical protein K0H81_14295 [Shewanella halotolerans]